MDKLINEKDFQDALKMHGKTGRAIAGFLMRLFAIKSFNRIYDSVKDKEGEELLDKLLGRVMHTRYEVSDEDLQNIPAEPFILVSNHPFGAIDGIILMKILSSRCSNYKMLANFILNRIRQLDKFFLPVDPFRSGKKQNVIAMKLALEHVKGGGCISIFPAGQVAALEHGLWGRTKDYPWKKQIVKLIRSAEVPVVPVYFEGRNSRLFYLLGLIHPLLRVGKVPTELVNKSGKTIRLHIGRPVPVSRIRSFGEDLSGLGDFLYRQVNDFPR